MEASSGFRPPQSSVASGVNSAELCPLCSCLRVHHLSPLPVHIPASPAHLLSCFSQNARRKPKDTPVPFSLELVQIFNEPQPRSPPEPHPRHRCPCPPSLQHPLPDSPTSLPPSLILPLPLPLLSSRIFCSTGNVSISKPWESLSSLKSYSRVSRPCCCIY